MFFFGPFLPQVDNNTVHWFCIAVDLLQSSINVCSRSGRYIIPNMILYLTKSREKREKKGEPIFMATL